MAGTYVDDSSNVGNHVLEKQTEQTLEKFNSNPRVYDCFDIF